MARYFFELLSATHAKLFLLTLATQCHSRIVENNIATEDP